MNPIHIFPNLKKRYQVLFLEHRQKWHVIALLFLVMFLNSCEFNPFYSEYKVSSIRRGEYISRMHDERVEIPLQGKKEMRPYPWKCLTIGNYPKITKEHFRCKGSDRNPDKYIEQGNDVVLVKDCGGLEQHSLPLRENKEFIYPILIHLLNYVQLKVQKPVVITSGHRCPDHNRYNDPLPKSQFSKHMVGGEVSFYVKGLEEEPERVIALLQEYFQENEDYQGQSEYLTFKRWERSNTDVSTQPWYNKEVFIKLYKATEGRNFDNSHSYPYIAIQVRYDRTLKESVSYSWDKAFRSYWRW